MGIHESEVKTWSKDIPCATFCQQWTEKWDSTTKPPTNQCLSEIGSWALMMITYTNMGLVWKVISAGRLGEAKPREGLPPSTYAPRCSVYVQWRWARRGLIIVGRLKNHTKCFSVHIFKWHWWATEMGRLERGPYLGDVSALCLLPSLGSSPFPYLIAGKNCFVNFFSSGFL